MAFSQKNEKGEKEMDRSYFVSHKGVKGGYADPQYPGQNWRVNSELIVDGQEDLSHIITFNDGGCVYGMTLTGSPGLYDFVVNVDAQGPKGAFSGSGHLRFQDESGDVYELSIYSSTRSTHTVRYNSEKPNIVKVEWSY